jgi:ribose transport system ATP-binding protein
MTTARLVMSGVKKAFGATRALAGVDFEAHNGEAHALIGENGAGKSTLMNVLCGVVAPDAGTVTLNGRPFAPRSPLQARRSGVAMIHQELMLAPALSVLDNVMLGQESARWGWIRSRRCRAQASSALTRLGHGDLSLDMPVARLSVAQQQIVEIARALVSHPTVMVMDEPTSSLGPTDAQALFKVVGQLTELGVAVVYISHFLEECAQLCARYTVLRDGRSVDSGDMEDAAPDHLVRQMVGRAIELVYPANPRVFGEPILRVEHLAGAHGPGAVSFEVKRGEIFGIAGLVGAGRTETLRTLFGLDRQTGGTVVVSGAVSNGCPPPQRQRQGFGFASESRKAEGLLMTRSIADNLTMTRYSAVMRGGLISRRLQERAARDQLMALDVKAEDPLQIVAQLSGGNQQKVALGRLLHQDADILLLDEPTRGIDVASKAQIYRVMADLAGRGKAIVFVSSYLPELLGVCDTIGVMFRGAMAAVRPAYEWTEDTLASAAVGMAEVAS